MSLVSVIIPTFNRATVLARALDSVTHQTYSDWELIVVDDGSQDHTQEMLAAWLEHRKPTQPVQILKCENGGVSRARNLGAARAKAPWLAFLDSDDEWLPSKLSDQLKLAEHFQLIHGEEIWIRRGVRVNPMKKHAKSGGRIFSRCVDLCCISPSTAMIRRDLFAQSGGFNEEFPVCEDYELWLRVASRYEVGFVSTPLITKYGGHPDQLSLRFHAMDYFRVKALMPFLNDEILSRTERLHVAQTILHKCEILLNGYVKHGNLAQSQEVEEWRQRARSALTQVQSVHSAADFLPRSEDRLNL